MMVKQDQNSVKSIFVAGIQDADVNVQLMALRASIDYMIMAKSSIRNCLADLLPLILNVDVFLNLGYSANHGKSKHGTRCC